MSDIVIFDLIIGMLFISGISMVGLGLYGRRFVSRVPAATPYALLMFSAAAWAMLYALDLLTVSLPLKVFYHNLRFLFLPFFSVLELWLVIAYVKKTEWLRLDWAVLALIIPVASAILAITSPYHNLFRYNFSINTAGPVPFLQYSESAFFALYYVYSFILLVVAIILLIMETRNKGTLWEKQTILLLLALAIPTIINYMFTAGLTPVHGVNLAPSLLWIPAILYTVALFRYRFLDIIPIARSRLIETLSKPVMVLDTEGRVIDMNLAACNLFSLTYSSAIGRPVDRIVPDWPDFLSLCREGTAQKKDLFRAKSGRIHYYIGSVEPFLTPKGEIEGHLILLEDITDKKNAEAALRESEEKYRTIIENMQDLFYRTDTEGKITMISPSGAKLAGYASPDQMIGLDVGTIYLDPQERVKFLEVLRQNGSVYAYPVTLRFRDGTIRYMTTSSQFYKDAHGNVQGVEGVIHDVTDQRRAEDALRMVNKKLNLLSGITRHDIRNQLTALKGYLQLSEESVGDPVKIEEYLVLERKITDTIDHQISFTHDYEDMGVNAPVWQSVSACIGVALTGLPMRGIRIDMERANLEVFADPLLERVFHNLIENTLRYGGDSLNAIRISSLPEGTSLVLVYEDDGAGIAAEDKPRLFTKGFGKNTGLGLFLSREILSITGITITETGIPGKGARFEIRVPPGFFRFVL